MKRISSFFLALVMIISSLTVPPANIVHAEADANVDLTLVTTTPKVTSGDTGLLEMNLKIAGSQESIQENMGDNVSLEVQFPENTEFYEFDAENLEEYSINGVTPIFAPDTRVLTYELGDVKTGISGRLTIPVNTFNGITPNGTNLEFSARLVKGDGSSLVETEPTKMEISSVFNESISKTYTGVIDSDALMPKKGNQVAYLIKGSVAIPNRGGMYIQPESEILIKDTLPEGLEFVSANSLRGDVGEPAVSGQEVTWTVTAPALDEQKASAESGADLYEFEMEVVAKVTLETDKAKILTNKVKLQSIDISGAEVVKEAAANVTVVADGNDIVFGDGSWFPALTYGPKDGSGAYGGGAAGANPNPAVNDTGRLRMFEYYNIALNGSDILKKDGVEVDHSEWNPAKIVEEGYQKIVTKQSFSDSLIFDGIVVWTPKSYYHSSLHVSPLPVYPKTTISFKLEDGSVKQHEVKFPTAGGFITYVFLDRKDMGLEDGDHVKSFDIEYKNEDGSPLFGGVSLQTFPQFSIKKGTVGEVVWQTEYETTLNDGRVYLRTADDTGDNIGPRTATVVQNENSIPKVMETVEFVKKDGNVVKTGDNQVLLRFYDGRVSSSSMEGDFSSVVLLPYGVKFKEGSVPKLTWESSRLLQKIQEEAVDGSVTLLDGNYKGTGQQLVKITWDRDLLQPGDDLSAVFDVDITKDTPNSMELISYTASTKALKLESIVPDAAPIEEDTDDINKDNTENQQRIKAKNVYRMYTKEDLQIEKFVKGSMDKEFSKYGHTNLGGEIEYKLNLTNTTKRNIYTLGFIDVLPSVGDLGIVDNVARQSAFTPLLNGPIMLPAEWADKIDVYYSTSKNPSREDLYSKVDYQKTQGGTLQYKHVDPDSAEDPNWQKAQDSWTEADWQKIHSFKLAFKEDTVWLKGQDISLSFKMLAPKKGDQENLPDESIVFSNLKEAERTEATELRAAWNSFAVTTNGLLPTEPERVGVVLFKESGAVRVKYFIEGTEIELDNPDAGQRVQEGEDKGWYTVKEKGSEIGQEYDSTTADFQPKTLVKDGKTYVLTEKKIRDDSDPVKGQVEGDTQYIIYEYKLQPQGDVYVKYFIEGTDTELENPKGKDKTEDGWYTVKKDSPVGEEYKTDNDELKPPTLKDKDGNSYVLTKTETRKDSDPKDGKVKEETQYVKYEYKKTGAVRVKYFIEGTEIELDNPKAGDRVSGEEDKNWYTVKEKGSEIGQEYDSTTADFQPKTLVKDGKTYVLTEKKIRDDSDPVKGQVEADTQYIIYEYKLQPQGDVYVKYFIEGTDTELENPKGKDKTKDGWYTVKKDSPVGEEYKTDNKELKPPTLKDKDGNTYVLTKTETRKDSDPKDGKVKEKTQYVKYEYKKTGAVRVKYFIEGTKIELDNPKAGDRVTGKEDKNWYTVKEKGSEIGQAYDSTTADFQPKTLVKDGKTYVLTKKKIRSDSAAMTGEVKADTQYIIYEYKLVKDTPKDPKDDGDKPKNDDGKPKNGNGKTVSGDKGGSTYYRSSISSGRIGKSSPKTGDSSNVAVYGGIAILALGLLLFMARVKRKSIKK